MDYQPQNTGIKYLDREATPLKFHKFTRFVTLPLGFVLGIIGFISSFYFLSSPYAGYYASIDALYDVAMLVLEAASFIGFFKWKRYAWYSIMSYFCLNGAYNVLLFAVNMHYAAASFSEALGSLTGSMLYVIPAFIYYKKRKQLFLQ